MPRDLAAALQVLHHGGLVLGRTSAINPRDAELGAPNHFRPLPPCSRRGASPPSRPRRLSARTALP